MLKFNNRLMIVLRLEYYSGGFSLKVASYFHIAETDPPKLCWFECQD